MTELIQPILINARDLACNEGQIEGVPSNPRFIRDERYKSLLNSIDNNPDFIALRELIVFEVNGTYIILGGNMRFRALSEKGVVDFPCKVVPVNTSIEKLKNIALLDNSDFGQHDWNLLANEWEEIDLKMAGYEFPTDWGMDEEGQEEKDLTSLLKLEYVQDDFELVKDALAKMPGTPEQVVWELLGLG